MKISHNDPRISWHGHVSLEQTDTYTRPWRIPFPQKALFPDALTLRAGTHSGVRMAFYSDTRNIAGSILPYEANQKLDLYVDGKFFGSEDLAEKASFAWRDLPVGEKLLEFWLPQFGDFALTQLEADEGSTIKLYQNTKPRWITYGSSITHCAGAESPSMTWPAIVAREQGFNLTCLGFGGQCHLDIQVACMMRDMPADALSICAGINIYGSDSLSARTFGPALLGFIQILREKHPETPL
ncbi:MAG: SGNH/GDSL hydrolase family protein, partial [Chthoniobacterales bacterium]